MPICHIIWKKNTTFVSWKYSECILFSTVSTSENSVENWMINNQQRKKCPTFRYRAWIFFLIWRGSIYKPERYSVDIIHLCFVVTIFDVAHIRLFTIWTLPLLKSGIHLSIRRSVTITGKFHLCQCPCTKILYSIYICR